jgi:plastocyanin
MLTLPQQRRHLRYKPAVAGIRQGRSGARSILLALSLGIAALALAPTGASAAVSPGACVQTNAPTAPDQASDWTCWGPKAVVSGYEVRRGNDIMPLPQGVDGHITNMQVDLVDASGALVPIDRLMLHHIVFFNASRSDSACGGPGERFYGAGEERARLDLPDGYGYEYNASDVWGTAWMYMNHRAQTDEAYVQYTATIDPDPDIRPVRSYWLDVGSCQADPIYNVPGSDLPTVQKCKKAGKNAKTSAKRRAGRCRKAAKRQKRARNKIIASDPTYTVTKDVQFTQNGFIVSGGGHTHGGAELLTLTKPGCGNTEIARSEPTWGNADHPFYNVKPVLHEPGPIGMSGFSIEQGIPVKNNQVIRLNSTYDNIQPHARVMGIYVVYFVKRDGALGDPPIEECAGAPAPIPYDDGIPEGEAKTGRTEPVPFTVPLTGLDQSGTAVTIDGPPGAFRTLSTGATVTVGDRFFSEPNVIVKKGTTLNYQFNGKETHNVTLANGPMGIGSPDAKGGAVYNQTFSRTGTYRLFCGLHPVQMSERVVVKNTLRKKHKK